ncbi:uncharacterized protein [Triticum aestivum]|uniref:uncharacterized protein n=1 Tax=Triticum aestivum TaxID=4565 RepID=UPI001D013F2A|nr:uncharacterized protein LOC123087181 [Triticum aestivum]XP_044408587.1 uncharacterized protein LOC123133114 [Triticum aestivum]XP_044432052.1 uncharacterized protein LOC123157939 [Triticum aestivum]
MSNSGSCDVVGAGVEVTTQDPEHSSSENEAQAPPTPTSRISIFFLDNIDLGMFNKKHDVLHQISAFDQTNIRRMITMATDIGTSVTSYSNSKLRPDADVCYARRKQPECTEKINNQPADVTNQNQSPEHHTEARLGAVHASSSSAALSWMSGHHTVSSIQSTLQSTFPADTQVW